ncbi:hypothetical protein M9H77_08396 [Catharanthus roseus]|uniref:Uncharacterized protein n=1 Tax=Catharanthus roseus TaxID=4058 RepID=A0ACC0BXP3_CATRO|nr:hypothetical protein M9H77_08396 [Catharanthus roseus]
MNGANKLETINYIIKYRSKGNIVKNWDLLIIGDRYYNPTKRYFRRRKYNRTTYKKPKRCTCWLCKEEGHYANECPKRKEKNEVEEEESSSDEETIKEPMCMLRAYPQKEDISQEDIQEIEDDEIYQKLIFTIKPNYIVSLADENLDKRLNLYYQLHRIRMPRGSKAFSITTKIIYAFCTSHHKEIIKVGQNSNIEIKDEYSYIAEYIYTTKTVK